MKIRLSFPEQNPVPNGVVLRITGEEFIKYPNGRVELVLLKIAPAFAEKCVCGGGFVRVAAQNLLIIFQGLVVVFLSHFHLTQKDKYIRDQAVIGVLCQNLPHKIFGLIQFLGFKIQNTGLVDSIGCQ
ncbi:hypothetical protein BMS3Abin05_01059 [bacterium BMS3Abin05]|nr:hypothetical protein BMS3Abin05_01059 [bacterium BMS3Abin05]